jgi:hypothetical protein
LQFGDDRVVEARRLVGGFRLGVFAGERLPHLRSGHDDPFGNPRTSPAGHL